MAYNMRDDIKEVYFTEEQLHEKVAELGARITEDYRDKNPLIVSVLKGSYVFMADLTRAGKGRVRRGGPAQSRVQFP